MEHLLEFLSGGHSEAFGRVNGELNEFFEDIVDSLVGRMDHIFFIKSVVAELIEKDFVGREIMGIFVGHTHIVHGEKHRGLAQLVFVEPVFQMAQRRNGEDELLIGIILQQRSQLLLGLFGSETLSDKLVGGQFMAVGDHLARSFVTKDPRGAQAKDNPFRLKEVIMRLSEMIVYLFEKGVFRGAPEIGVMAESAIELPSHLDNLVVSEWDAIVKAFQRLGDADWVIKHPERIHQSVESHSTAEAAHLVGEAGAQEEQAIAVANGLI